MTLDELWLATLQDVVNRAAHEVKDALNGVSVNLEVVRSRAARAGTDAASLGSFANAAADQLEAVTARAEAVLYLARPAKDPVDVAVVLKHLAALLVPATRANGGRLTVEVGPSSAPTTAPGQPTRLALAAGLLALIKEGGGRCRLESGDGQHGTMVRFSHESAVACDIDPAVANVIAGHNIHHSRSGPDLLIVFPGKS